MPVEIDGERYYSAKEAADYLGISRDTFSENVVKQKRLRGYKVGVFQRLYYKHSELDLLRRRVEPADERES